MSVLTALRQVGRIERKPNAKRIRIIRGSPVHRGIVWASIAILIAIVAYLPFYYSGFDLFRFEQVMVFAIGVLGLNLLIGFTGQISLGHSAFFGVGAYTSAILITEKHWNFVPTMIVAAVITFAAGFLIGIPALRLRGTVLAIVTLALAIVIVPLVKRFHTLTGGSLGINNITKPTAWSWTGLENDQFQFFLIAVITAVMFLLARNLVRGRIGRAMVSVRDNEVAAATNGVNVALIKMVAFAISAAYAGVAGSVYVIVVGSVSPDSFPVALSINYLAGLAVGGLATVSGAIFGGLFLEYVPVYAGRINLALSGVIYGGSLILVMFVMPTGAVGLLRRLRDLVFRVEAPPPKSTHGSAVIDKMAAPPPAEPAFAGASDEEAWTTTGGGGAI
jgi:branched-chain amino acid transport system permease protein